MKEIPPPKSGLQFIDVHCHVPFEETIKGIPSPSLQLEGFKEAGGVALMTSSVDMNTLQQMSEFARENDSVYYYVGWAPQTVTFTKPEIYEQEKLAWLEYVKSNKDYLAIGEIGLDFYHGKTLEQRNKQIEELRWVFKVTKDLGKPYVFHVRNAGSNSIDEQNPTHEFNQPDAVNKIMLNIIEEEGIDPVRCMFHCFSGPSEWGTLLSDKGFLLSVPSSAWGFKKWRRNIEKVPIENLVTETDAPFQHPNVMKPINEPKNVAYSIAAIAYTHDMDQDEVAEHTIKNAEKFFGRKF